jgi:hypothetical protein
MMDVVMVAVVSYAASKPFNKMHIMVILYSMISNIQSYIDLLLLHNTATIEKKKWFGVSGHS